MPTIDSCQPQVIRALQKEGWTVNNKPKQLLYNKRRVYIDIQASRGINGASQQILLAEVKCFVERKTITVDLYAAIGQYLVYQAMLDRLKITTPLYLILPVHIYNEFVDSTIEWVFEHNAIKVIIVDLNNEVIISWKP